MKSVLEKDGLNTLRIKLIYVLRIPNRTSHNLKAIFIFKIFNV